MKIEFTVRKVLFYRVGTELLFIFFILLGYFTTLYQHLGYLASEWYEGDNASEMSPGSSTDSYPAFAHIGLRENAGKKLNQVTCPDRESNLGNLVSRPDALTVIPQVWTKYHDLHITPFSYF